MDVGRIAISTLRILFWYSMRGATDMSIRQGVPTVTS